MTKTDFISAVAEKAEVTKKDASAVYEALVSVVTEQLANGEKISLVGFGNFEVSERSAHTGKNPQTGEEIKIPASKVPRFKPGKALKEAVNAPKKCAKKKKK